ncbi:flagellar motor protein MotB [Paenibacillus sp. FSL H8-0548]|uniref:flagellar motor protein MotB n=1 Tax=Paenibacillus sp. FSL H8-0548 TaxID=1920422 RepID=UPI00096E8536|nr:flagellar motor protein MotB [Paenibacillus sp. FSL H8-0548]OMF29075.1 flagellar motor protein MotB [Paenibacillus sp. FSL H8-0548]
MSRKHRHEEHEEHVDESWLIPYADLLTLLLALFIVLYSMNSVDVKKFEDMSNAFSIALSSGSGILTEKSIVRSGDDDGKKQDEAGGIIDSKEEAKDPNKELSQADKAMEELMEREQKNLEELKKNIDNYIEKNGLTSDLETKLNLSQLMITISDNALFAPAQANVKPESRELAVAIGKMLQQYPDYEVVVSGHTDTTPISTVFFKSNWDLSSMRAIRFMDILLENKQLKPERFSAIGFGEYRPVADNKTAAGKSKNRRVEVSIMHTYSDATNPQKISVAK